MLGVDLISLMTLLMVNISDCCIFDSGADLTNW